MLGGGLGNDVADALTHGAQHVDVVEMIQSSANWVKNCTLTSPMSMRESLSITKMPEHSCAMPKKYDLIEFAFLDPGTTLNTASFVRVDNFVYTVQSIKSALSHLNQDGLLQ